MHVDALLDLCTDGGANPPTSTAEHTSRAGETIAGPVFCLRMIPALYCAMTYGGVIFDVDGTLADTNDGHIDAWRRAFASMGYDVTPERMRPTACFNEPCSS